MTESAGPPSEAEMIQAMNEWMTENTPVPLVLSPSAAMAVLGHLQLALRHPSNTGHAAEIVREVCGDLIAQIAPDADSPARAFCMAGFDPAYDRDPNDV